MEKPILLISSSTRVGTVTSNQVFVGAFKFWESGIQCILL